MLRQEYAEQSEQSTVPAGRTLPHWQVVARRWLGVALERVVGECWSPNPWAVLLVLGVIVALLVVIAVTLSVGNALLVALVGIVMRVACERRLARR